MTSTSSMAVRRAAGLACVEAHWHLTERVCTALHWSCAAHQLDQHMRGTGAGKMVPFAGWSMPIQYKDSLVEATLHCRSNGSLFDVSHMCGLTLKVSRAPIMLTRACLGKHAKQSCFARHQGPGVAQGKDTIKFLEGLVVGDIQGVKDGMGTLSVFTNEQGGIIDDTVITKVPAWPSYQMDALVDLHLHADTSN